MFKRERFEAVIFGPGSGRETTASFTTEAAAIAWLAGRVDEIERNGWDATVRLHRWAADGGCVDLSDALLPGASPPC